MQTVLSITAIFLGIAYLLYFHCCKEKGVNLYSLPAAVLAATTMEIFDLLAILHPEDLLIWKKFTLTIESFIPPLWLWFSLTYARQNELRSISLFQRFLLAISPIFVGSLFCFPVTSFFYSPDFATEGVLFLGNAGFTFYLLLLIYLINALINLEMTLASATHASRWKIKFEILGAGVYLAVMVFYYSQGLLYRTINMNLVPARTILFILALAMMAYSRLSRGNGVKVYVSRQIVFKSVVLLAVGVYLLGLGLMGEGMKHFGDGFQRIMSLVTAFTAGLGLIIILLSETAKRKFKIFIHKNFYQNKYDYRTQWLQFTDRISTAKTGDGLLMSIIMGFCDTFGMGYGALFLWDHERKIYQQATGTSEKTTQISFQEGDALVTSIANGKWVADLRKGALFTGNEGQKKFSSDHMLFFAIPLFMNARMEGFIIVGRPLNPDETYDYEDFDLMRTLARQASSALLNLRLSEQLARSREMAAVGRVSTFVMHDLKNLVSAVSLMVDNAKEYIAVPEFQAELLNSLSNTVKKMQTLIQRLKNLPEKEAQQRTPVDLLQLLQETAVLVNTGNFQVSGEPVSVTVDRDEFQKVALNLMLNAVEASNGKRPVRVEVGIAEAPFFRVKDEGCGIPGDYLRNNLFTPFKSTKSKGLGIGLYQSKQIVESYGGKIDVKSELDRGSEFTVWLPKTS